MNCKYHEYPDKVDNDELGIRANQVFIPEAPCVQILIVSGGPRTEPVGPQLYHYLVFTLPVDGIKPSWWHHLHEALTP